jgi:glycosyl transferase family 25
MFNFDKIYVINLESRFDRKHAFNTRYRHKLNYEYINAVPGESINVPDLIKQGKLNKSFYDPNGMVNKNIIACAFSHRLAIQTFVDSGAETCLILEDDVIIDTSKINETYITQLQNEISDLNWDIIFLGRQELYIFKNSRNDKNDDVSPLFCKHKKALGGFAAHAYLINKKSAKKLLEHTNPIKYAADVLLDMRCDDMNVFCIKESLIRQLIDLNYDLGKIKFNEAKSDTSQHDHWTNQCYMFSNVDDTVQSAEFLENNTSLEGPNIHIGGLVKLNFKQ